MQITDPVADMLTRIRNANTAKHEKVDVPASNLKKSIAQILLDEGYIKAYEIVDDGTQGIIRITLKYLAGKEKVISGLRRVSKPGLRVYVQLIPFCDTFPFGKWFVSITFEPTKKYLYFILFVKYPFTKIGSSQVVSTAYHFPSICT